jgi:GNAT superfamily N-acetyltransferase
VSDAAILALFDRQMRREAVPDDAGLTLEREERITRAVGPGPGPEDNCILWSDLGEETADSVIAGEHARARAENRALEWKVYGHDRPSDLAERLIAQGFLPDEPETLLAFDLAQPLPRAPEIGIRRLFRPADLGPVGAIKAAVWGEDASSSVETLARTLADWPELLSVYVALDGEGRPAAAGWLKKPPGRAFASLWGGATMPNERGKGLYRALVAARLKEARDAGYAYATVDARETSRPILERLGFARLATVRGYIWVPDCGLITGER